MKKEFLYSKIHRAVVTEANLNYIGSITVSKRLLEKANICEFQKVLVVDIDNGNRFETYVLSSEEENTIRLNGAAARLVHVGDKIIIMSFCFLEMDEFKKHAPIIVLLDDNNQILE